MGRRSNPRRWGKQLKSEKGYLLLSTLFFLVFSGLFAQSLIKISGNHMIQLRQVSSAYQSKSVLNMSRNLLFQEFEKNAYPEKGNIRTSEGNIVILRRETDENYLYTLTLVTPTGTEYSDQVNIPIQIPEEPPEIEEELEKEEPSEDIENDEKIQDEEIQNEEELPIIE